MAAIYFNRFFCGLTPHEDIKEITFHSHPISPLGNRDHHVSQQSFKTDASF